MGERVDFSENAPVYDRRHGAVLSREDIDRLWAGANLHPGARVLDIGAGTGRVAIPLAARGCRVAAMEPAAGMLQELKKKASAIGVRLAAGEGARLPFASGAFDVVVIARLLYLTSDWRAILHDAHRVLAGGGCLLHEWGNGEGDEEWVRIREEARRLFESAGVPSPFHPGVRSEADVDADLGELGLVREREIVLGPGPEITLREFLRRLVDGELSYIWHVPDSVRADCLPRLQRWSDARFDLEARVPMPKEIRWTIHRKAA